MNNQDLEALNYKMEQIEKRYPDSYMKNANWLRFFHKRESLTQKLMEQELKYQTQKLDRLDGKSKIDCQKLIKQYENYLEKYSKRGIKEYDKSRIEE